MPLREGEALRQTGFFSNKWSARVTEQDPDQPEVGHEGEQSEAEQSVEAGEVEGEAEEPSLADVVNQLQDDVLVAKEASLRAQADAQNVKRRAEQDVEKARKFALEQFAKELLPVVDNLERALEAASGDDAIKPIAEGVELTLKSFFDAMKKFHIEAVDPVGEPFDPQFHQAMSMVENNEVEPNTVTMVMQKGYTLNARLVRPAMVVVSKTAD
ncbi:MAG: nucleotide exchange factor GrpE [Halieaceae bacterium]|jgi:molecular chaperone GrpE|nr:nucleotide exchange factor GrpE [Halieaceae bacterium]